MKPLGIILLSVMTWCLTACATPPENIAPSYISDMSYSAWDCDQLAKEQPRLVSALSSACEAQRRCRTGDIVGVVFIGLPMSSLSGSNMTSEVARLKGELQALQRAAILKRCSLPPVPVEALDVRAPEMEEPEPRSR